MEAPSDKTFRWINFGSCTFKIAFFNSTFINNGFQNKPLQMHTVWRRSINSLMSDWQVLERLNLELNPSPYLDSFFTPKKIFKQADLICVDLIMDIDNDFTIGLKELSNQSFIPFSKLITNFPFDTTKEIKDHLFAYKNDSESCVNCWKEFIESIQRPIVFMIYEYRDDIKEGYHAAFRHKLLRYQNEIKELAMHYDFVHVINMDDLFSEFGEKAYIDRHHPSPLGWEILKKKFPEEIINSGILIENSGGLPLDVRNWNVPERGDFISIDFKKTAKLNNLNNICKNIYCIGSSDLTENISKVFKYKINTISSFSKISVDLKPDLIILLKWMQPAFFDMNLKSIINKYPESLIEITCLWSGRIRNIISKEEFELRKSIENFGKENHSLIIKLPNKFNLIKKYLSRCVLYTHFCKDDCLIPLAETSENIIINFDDKVLESCSTIDLIPIFGTN